MHIQIIIIFLHAVNAIFTYKPELVALFDNLQGQFEILLGIAVTFFN